MAKRFTDPEKWEDPWFFNLTDTHKLFWIYLLDKCDHAGIWKANQKLTELILNGKIEWDRVSEVFGNRIAIIGDYWFITKFMIFQYGKDLHYGKAVRSAVKLVEEHGFGTIAAEVMGEPYIRVREELPKCYSTLKATATAKATALSSSVVTKQTTSKTVVKFVKPSAQEVEEYAKSISYKLDGGSFVDFYDSKGWLVGKTPMKDWKAAVRTWKRTDQGGSSGSNVGESTSGVSAIFARAREVERVSGLRKVTEASTLLGRIRNSQVDQEERAGVGDKESD